MNMTVKCGLAAICALGITSAALAQGGGYSWDGPRETRSDVVASHPGGEIFAAHPNILGQVDSIRTDSQVPSSAATPLYAGHGNGYYLARDKSLTDDPVEMAGQPDSVERE